MTRVSFFTAFLATLAFAAGATQIRPVLGEAAPTPSAQQAGQDQHAHEQPQQTQANMPGMMIMHEQMMAEMKAADAKLDALVTDMNAVSGNAKIDAVATVVSELVRQQRAMHAHMNQMHQQMMGGRGMMMQR